MFGEPYSPIVPSFTRWIVRVQLGDREQQVERPDDVVHLGVDGVVAVDHRVRAPSAARRSARPRRARSCGGCRVTKLWSVRSPTKGTTCSPETSFQVATAALQLADRDERVRAHLVVVVATDEVVDDAHVVAGLGEMQGGRPTRGIHLHRVQGSACSVSSSRSVRASTCARKALSCGLPAGSVETKAATTAWARPSGEKRSRGAGTRRRASPRGAGSGRATQPHLRCGEPGAARRPQHAWVAQR